jgi:hypothetical protein
MEQKKKFFWDTIKNSHRHRLAANMGGEAFLGFGAFNTKRITGQDTVDFIKLGNERPSPGGRWRQGSPLRLRPGTLSSLNEALEITK